MGMDTWSMYSIFMSDMREFSHQIDISYSHLFFFHLNYPYQKLHVIMSLVASLVAQMVKQSAFNA